MIETQVVGGQGIGHGFVRSGSMTNTEWFTREVHDDESALTTAGVLPRVVDWFAARGITIERVLSENGSVYKSR